MDAITKFDGEYRFLSNFYAVEGGVFGYPTVEHYFQAMKTRRPALRHKIKECVTPGQAKRMGRDLALRNDWQEIRLDVMRVGIEAKFASDTVLAWELRATGERLLVEGNTWHDHYWGVCDGRGANHLGLILMAQREYLNVVLDAECADLVTGAGGYENLDDVR